MAEFMLKETDILRALAGYRPQDAARWSTKAEEAIQTGIQMSQEGDAFHACEMIDDAILIYSVMVKRQA
jgi:hypothetical protein